MSNNNSIKIRRIKPAMKKMHNLKSHKNAGNIVTPWQDYRIGTTPVLTSVLLIQ